MKDDRSTAAARAASDWRRRLAAAWFRATLGHPFAVLALVVALVAGLAVFATRFELDASADSLVLENDAAFDYYRAIRARYGSDDFLVVTYTPDDQLFSDAVLDRIGALRDELAAVDQIATVTSLLDVPLMQSPPVGFAEMTAGGHRLRSPETERALAEDELTGSPLYADLLVGRDAGTAGLYLELEPAAARSQDGTRAAVAAVRAVLDRHREGAEIHLAGVPMIVADMIRFIEHDLRVFGAGVLAFIVVLLALSFRRLRWVVMPLAVCGACALAMVGVLGLIGKPVTVVSSNFLPVLLIVTLSMMVHLIVRHEELARSRPEFAHRERVEHTVRDKFAPCLYTALTTMVAFGSLTVSDLRPVIDFGWMMVGGIALAVVLVFVVFPAALARLAEVEPTRRRFDPTGRLTAALARLVDRHAGATLVVGGLLFAFGVAGALRLDVENRFIDYFSPDTEIHQGMVAVDRRLGGTTPLDVIVDADPRAIADEPATPYADGGFGGAGFSGRSYWFNAFRFDTVKRIHDYLDSLPETGKVLSLATSVRIMEQLNGGRPLDNLLLATVHGRMPEDVGARLFDPYLSDDGNQLRFAVRIYESNPELDRGVLLERIRAQLGADPALSVERVHLTGMTVLYNNMLESLFRSQAQSAGFVLVAVFALFLAVFRSPALALVALAPNLLVAAAVLGLMGALGLPLDMMTITIAAIALGIGVDDTIHYLHRFVAEFDEDRDYRAAAHRCHASVGRAMCYTSVTITLGFSILALSEFVPTIHFGLLTGLAMMAALIVDLTVLPALLAVFKPLGGEGGAEAGARARGSAEA